MRPLTATLAPLAAAALLAACATGPTGPDARTATIQRTANGVPHISATDPETLAYAMAYAYAQDNELSWVDWSLLRDHSDLLEFTRRLIRFRKAHPVLRRTRFLIGQPFHCRPDIAWFGRDGRGPDWHHDQMVACLLNGHRDTLGLKTDDDHLFMIFNASEHPVTFHPPAHPGKPWRVELSTQEKEPELQKPHGHIVV